MKKLGIGSRLLAALLALTMIVSMIPLAVFAADGDIRDGETGLDTNINTLDTISWPIKIYDYLNDGLLFEYASAQDSSLTNLGGDAYGGGAKMPGDISYGGDILGSDFTVNSSEAREYYDGECYDHWLYGKSNYNVDYAQQGSGTAGAFKYLQLRPWQTTSNMPDIVISDFTNDRYYYLNGTTSYPRDRVRYAVVVYKTSTAGIQLTLGMSTNLTGAKTIRDYNGYYATGPDGYYVNYDVATSTDLLVSDSWNYVVVDMNTNAIANRWDSITKVTQITLGTNLTNSKQSLDLSHIAYFSTAEEATRFGEAAKTFSNNPGDYLPDQYYTVNGTSYSKHWNMGNNTAFTMLYANDGGGWNATSGKGGSNSWENGYFSYMIGYDTSNASSTANSYRQTAKNNGLPVSDSIYFFNSYSGSEYLNDYDFGYDLYNFMSTGVMTAGLLENDLVTVKAADGKLYRIPQYKKDTVEYITYMVQNSLTIGQKDRFGNYNYNFVQGSPSDQFIVDGKPVDLATALRSALGLKAAANNEGNYTYPASAIGSYEATMAKTDKLIGAYADVKDNINTFHDAAYFLLHNLFVDNSYNQLQDDYNYLVLSKAPVTGTGKEAFVFDAGFTTGNYESDPNSQSAVVYNKTNGTISLSSAIGKDEICYNSNQWTTRNPFLPVTDADGYYGCSGTPYFREDGARTYADFGDTYVNRNYNYVMQANAEFVYHYQDDLFFQFEGDDDVYLFVNGELVLDIGAAHSITTVKMAMNDYVLAAQKKMAIFKANYGYRADMDDDKFEDVLTAAVKGGTITADQKDEYRRWHHLNLVDGESYSIDFYYMERHGWGANMRVATNILMTDPTMITEKKAYQDGAEIKYGGIVDETKRIEYSFSLTNEGENKLYNLTFNDYDIGVTLSPKTGLTVKPREEAEKENLVIVTDARGQSLEASDLIVRVEGFKDEAKTKPVSLDVRFDGQNPNEELKQFLRDLTSNDGTASGNTTDLFSGSGLWRHATVTIRGIYCQLNEKQIADEIFNNAVFTTANPAIDSDLVLNSADTHQVRLIGNARHIYQWSEHDVYFTREDLLNWMGGSVEIASKTYTASQLQMTTCRKDGTTFDFPDTIVRDFKTLTVNYLEPGTELFFIKLYRDTNNDEVPDDLNGNGKLDEKDYLIVPLAVYVTDLKDDVVVLDYGLKAELTGKNGITANDYFTVPNLNTGYSIMGMTKTNPSYLKDTSNLTKRNYNRISFAPVSGRTIECEDGTYEYTVDGNDDKLYFTPDDFMAGAYSIYMAVTIHELDKAPSAVGTANAVSAGYSIDITKEVQMYQKITVLPATVMYYEDDFAGITYKSDAVNSGTGSDVLMQGVDQSVNYGADQTYQLKDNAQYSGNSMKAIRVTEHGKLAEFTFKGTGFELIGRTNAFDSASLLIHVRDGKQTQELKLIPSTSATVLNNRYNIKDNAWSSYVPETRTVYLDITGAESGTWQKTYAQFADENGQLIAAPGVAMKRVQDKRYSITVPYDAQYIIFSDGAGNETGKLILPYDLDLYAIETKSWGKSKTTRTIYFEVDNTWTRPYAYYWSETNKKMVVEPGATMSRVSGKLYRVEVPDEATGVRFINVLRSLPVITEFNNTSEVSCDHTNHYQNGHCTKCGLYVGHLYYQDQCSNCGQARLDYYLVGYINGADYACEGDNENMGQYKFVNGKLTATFKTDGYVFVKTTGNANYFMTNGYPGANVTSAFLYNTTTQGLKADKLHVPGGVELTFTLVENKDGTLTLSYTTSNDDVTDPTKTVYFNNTDNWEAVKIYYWSFYNATMLDWPGKDMKPVASEDGIYVFDLPVAAEYVIFNDGSGLQTMDLTVPADNMIYSTSGFNKGWSVYNPGKTTLSFDNTASKWNKVNIYYWSEQEEQMVEWPGVEMTPAADNRFTAAIPSNATKVLFNNGSGSQTADLDVLKNGDVYIYGTGWASQGFSDTVRTVYFKNTAKWDNIHVHYWDANGEGNLVAWPGDAMIQQDGDVFKASIPAAATHVIFNNGSNGHQTLDLKLEDGLNLFVYDQTAADSTPTGSWLVYGEGTGEAPATRTVYLINSGNWAIPYAHYWVDGGDSTTWPGVAMTHVEGNRYSVTVPAEADFIIFNNNSGTQTGNLALIEGLDVYDFSTQSWNNDASATRTIYLENNTGWATPYAYFWMEGANLTQWPGVQMTSVSGNRYSVEIPIAATMIIFNNGNGGEGNQTADLTLLAGQDLYNLSTGEWSSSGVIPEDTTTQSIYYANTNGWNKVYVHYWSASNEGMVVWPGVEMTQTEDGVFTANIPGSAQYVIFNNGNGGDGNQTSNLTIPTNGANYYYLPTATCGTWQSYEPQRVLYFDVGDAGWSNVNAYYWSAQEQMVGWPGAPMTKVTGTLYTITVPAAAEMVIFNDGAGNQTADLSITGARDKYSYNTGEWSSTTRTIYFEHNGTGSIRLTYSGNGIADTRMIMSKVKNGIYRCVIPMDAKYVSFEDGTNVIGPVVLSDDHDLYTAKGWDLYDPAADYRNVIYFENTQGWTDAYIHYWGEGINATTWPGLPMTFVDDHIYMANIPVGATGVVFNNGMSDGNNRQTVDLTVSEDKNLFILNKEGGEGSWSVYAKTKNDAIHQVPVVRVDELPLGTYTVDVMGMPTYLLDGEGKVDQTKVKNTYLYLDGIRIYQPLGKVNGYYPTTENGAEFKEIRDLILQGNAAVATFDKDTKVYSSNVSWTENRNGKDGDMKLDYVGNQLSSINDYLLLGPNNETYLNGNAQTQAMIFYVKEKAGATHHALQVAARGIDEGLFMGSTSAGVNATLYQGVSVENPDGSVGYGWRPLDTVLSGTEQYYTVDYSACPYLMEDNARIYQVALFVRSGMISFTNVKFVGLELESTKVGEATTKELESGLNPQLKDDETVSGSTSGDPFDKVNNLVSISTQMAATQWIQDEQKAIQLKYPALSFEDEVFYNVFFTIPGLDEQPVEMGLLMFDTLEENGTVYDASAVIPGATAVDGMYVARSLGVQAKDLGKTLYFRVYAQMPNGNYVYSKAASYSVRQYAKAVLEGNYTVETKALIAAMLKYGEAARNYFGGMETIRDLITEDVNAFVSDYRTDLLESAAKPDASKAGYFAATATGFTKKSPAVSFEGAFAIHYYFTPSTTVQGNMTLYYWNAEDYQGAEVLSADNATGSMVMTPGAQYTAAITDISAKDMDSTYYVAVVYQSNGQTYCSGVLAYSLANYCKSKATAQGLISDLAKATAVYGYYAKQLFG